MSSDDSRTAVNQAWWNERAGLHRQTDLYQAHIDRLKSGGLSLLPLEVRELGELHGLRVLHLQCHIGTDTLSLSRLGATVTGVDFSRVAIEEARKLASDLGIPASFAVCEISSLTERYSNSFDRVFTSHGVLSWLPDLVQWAEQIEGCLVPGGQLYLSEGHPLVWSLADTEPIQDTGLKLEHPYLAQERPGTFEESGSYADRTMPTKANKTTEWSWGIGDVVNALISAGLTIQHLNEHPEGFCAVTPAFQEGPDGHFRLPASIHGRYPLTFTVRAKKSGSTRG